jgi:hypothetical protein
VYVSCGEGVVDVFAAEAAGYRRVASVPTVSGARSSLFAPELDRLYVAVRARSNEPAAIGVFRPAMKMTEVLAAAALICCCGTAQAFRPFDGTDAAVADPGDVEVELGPAEYLREGSERVLFAPDLRLNFEFARDWEAAIEGDLAHALAGGMTGTSLVGNTASLKGVLREGSLQEKPGPSIATEFDVLLPGIHDELGTGVGVTGIVSQQWRWTTVHLNAAATLTREQHVDYFLDTIIEGPHDRVVPPVCEFS